MPHGSSHATTADAILPAIQVPGWAWAAFIVFVLAMLLLDLGVIGKKSAVIGIREALLRSAGWISLAMVFAAGVYFLAGPAKAMEFLTGYVIEYSLSVDNIFVFVLLFDFFRVAPEQQHKVLFWGIMGALVMRAIMIFAGVALITKFEWLIYVFGAFLIFTGIKLALQKEGEDHAPHENPLVKVFRRFVPVTDHFHGDAFFVTVNARRMATPLFIVLLMVETTDLIFAVDSIPAILAISRDPFIVFTSNVFAILGLRSLYFALAGLMDIFHLLRYALAAILVFVGVKMLLSHTAFAISIGLSLRFIGLALGTAIAASLITAFIKRVTALEARVAQLEGTAESAKTTVVEI
jgi:tellurite resistance protein TerC